MDPITELNRRLDNLIRLGTVVEVDHNRARARVKSGDLTTDWLPWRTPRAGTTREWDPPTVGEQVLVLSPTGEISTGVVIPGLYRLSHPPPSDDPGAHHRVYPDGAVVQYNHESHELDVTLPDDGRATIVAPGGITMVTEGDVLIAAGGRISLQGERIDLN